MAKRWRRPSWTARTGAGFACGAVRRFFAMHESRFQYKMAGKCARVDRKRRLDRNPDGRGPIQQGHIIFIPAGLKYRLIGHRTKSTHLDRGRLLRRLTPATTRRGPDGGRLHCPPPRGLCRQADARIRQHPRLRLQVGFRRYRTPIEPSCATRNKPRRPSSKDRQPMDLKADEQYPVSDRVYFGISLIRPQTDETSSPAEAGERASTSAGAQSALPTNRTEWPCR